MLLIWVDSGTLRSDKLRVVCVTLVVGLLVCTELYKSCVKDALVDVESTAVAQVGNGLALQLAWYEKIESSNRLQWTKRLKC